MREIIRLAWERLGIIASIVGEVTGRFIAMLFYFTILVPFGLASRLFSDPLRLSPALNRSWQERPSVSNELDAAKLQG